LVDIEQGTCDEWDHSYNVNLRAYALTAKHIIPIFKQNNDGKGAGAIINISSISGTVAFPASAPYAATKAAVAQMTRNLAADFGRFNIRANSISPGTIDSPTFRLIKETHTESSAIIDDLAMGKCLKRLGKAEEIVNMAVFAASDLCQFMTGTNLVVDGGYTIV
jgi:NAD(P)-dependent dehydrogenase (short-subunit alcohol dehydrogenase family)